MRNREKFYEELPDEMLSSFYYYIKKNIDNGVRVPLMMEEIKFIKKVAAERNLPLSQLGQRGHLFVKNEINLVDQEYPRLVQKDKELKDSKPHKEIL